MRAKNTRVLSGSSQGEKTINTTMLKTSKRVKRPHGPRPSSSMMMRESFDAAEIIADASNISAIKVETPRCCASPAPTLAKTASRTLISALSHGTKLPTCYGRLVRSSPYATTMNKHRQRDAMVCKKKLQREKTK